MNQTQSNKSDIPRKKLREITIQLLYSTLFHENPGDISQEAVMLSEVLDLTEPQINEIQSRISSIVSHRQEIYEKITQCSSANFYGEINSIERVIIEQAVYELLYSPESIDLPLIVSEAIRLAQRFEVPQAIVFLNGLLSAIHKQVLGS
jgi:transcription termination factor NusB